MAPVFVVPYGIKTTPYIKGIGFANELEHTRCGPGKREGYTIHFNIKGKGFFNGYPVKEGQGFLVPDGMYAHHYPDKNNPWSLLWITFHESEKTSTEIFSEYNADPQTNIFNFHSPIYVQDAVKKLCETKRISMHAFQILEMYFKIHCNCIMTEKETTQKYSPEIYVKYAVNYIADNIHRPITVEELTTRLGITQPYLYKLFMQSCDISPKQYILRAKLDSAKNMLLHTNLSITEIANAVGYPDILTFSRLFATKENCSPTTFRNKTKSSV